MARVQSRLIAKELNLTAFLKKWGKRMCDGMRRAIERKQTINGGAVRPNAASTRAKKGFTHRMKDTGYFLANAFRFKADKRSLTLYVPDTPHPESGTPLNDISYYNQPRSAAVPGAPGHNNPGSEHFGLPRDAEAAFFKDIEKEVFKQIDKNVKYKARITSEVTL